MGHENFAEQIRFITKLFHHLPFSPSLPSFGVAAIDKGSKRVIDSEELINRESLIQRLMDIKYAKIFDLPLYLSSSH